MTHPALIVLRGGSPVEFAAFMDDIISLGEPSEGTRGRLILTLRSMDARDGALKSDSKLELELFFSSAEFVGDDVHIGKPPNVRVEIVSRIAAIPGR